MRPRPDQPYPHSRQSGIIPAPDEEYLFISRYRWLEKLFSLGDYGRQPDA